MILDKFLKMSQTDIVRNKKGFTLIELMVVIAIIAILTVLGFLGIRSAQAAARDAGRVKLANQIRTQLEQYYSDNQTYPVAANFVALGAVAGISVQAALWTDPGCGAKSSGYPYVSTDTDAGGAGNWTPGAAGATVSIVGCVTQPSYGYKSLQSNGTTVCSTSPCPKYSLTLNKEGGGTVTYTQPQ